jgi:prepilin-type N-terminal cleavage/methylation domain-containing protein
MTKPNRLSNARGFGMVELMVVMALVAVITALGMPSFIAYWRSAALAAGADELAGILAQAKGQAIRENRTYCVQRTGNNLQFRFPTCADAVWTGTGTDSAGTFRLANGLQVSAGGPVTFTGTGGATAQADEQQLARRHRHDDRPGDVVSSSESGFTLAEVLVATLIIMVGLVAVATGFQFATAGIATGRGETVAIFLAEQRVEQLKATAMTSFTAAGLNAGTTSEFCLATNIGATTSNCQAGAITGAPSYQRTTTITDSGNGVNCGTAPAAPPVLCKRVQVRVTYRPVTSRGDVSQQRAVDIFTMLVPRN